MYLRNLQSRLRIYLTCPVGKLVQPSTPIITQWGYESKVALNSYLVLKCYTGTTTLTSVSWTNNDTNVPYTLTSNKYNVTFNKESVISNGSTIQANYTAIFKNGITNTESRYVTFLQNGINVVVDNAN